MAVRIMKHIRVISYKNLRSHTDEVVIREKSEFIKKSWNPASGDFLEYPNIVNAISQVSQDVSVQGRLYSEIKLPGYYVITNPQPFRD